MTDRIGIVVPTHNRLDLLRELVASLHDGGMPPGAALHVVNDGSRDGTAAWLDATGTPHLDRVGGGPAAARNAGWRGLDVEVVCFTDDDCVVTPGWAATLAAPILAGEADVVQGVTRPRPDHAEHDGPWSRTLRVERANGWYQTCNIAYRRSLLEAVDGFDESFPTPAGEDTDLALRAIAAGGRFAFHGDAVVHHAIHPNTLRDHLRQVPRWGDAVLVAKRHPEVRANLLHGVFQRPSHRTVVVLGAVAAASVAAAPWAPGAVLAGHLLQRAARTDVGGSPWRRLRVEAERLVVAAWETAHMLRGSIRHRTLVL